METATQTRAAVRSFLAGLCDVSRLGDTDDIFSGGFVNSLYLVQLLNFVQKECAVLIEEDDYDMDNFRSVAAVAEFVARKRASTSETRSPGPVVAEPERR